MANLLEKLKGISDKDQDGKTPGERLSIKVAELLQMNEQLRKENEKLKTYLSEAVEEWEFGLYRKSELLVKAHKDHERILKIKRVLNKEVDA